MLLAAAFACVLVLCIHVSTVHATYGIDVSMAIAAGMTQDTWNCLHNEGYEFAIIQGFDGGYHVNQNLATNVAQARAAGFQYVDTYIWSAPYCGTGSGSGDANALMDYINANQVNVGMVCFSSVP
jgi:hypothetical protein